MRALHPQPIEADLGQLGMEFPPRNRKQLQIRRSDSGLIGKWIRERKYLTPNHRLSPFDKVALSLVKAGKQVRHIAVNQCSTTDRKRVVQIDGKGHRARWLAIEQSDLCAIVTG